MVRQPWKRTLNCYKPELVYLPKSKYCVYPRMVYRLTIVMPPHPPPPILDDRKWISSRHFRAISNFDFFHKMAAGGHFGWPIAFLAISDQYSIFYFVHKMAAGDHFGLAKITFDRISRHFRSIRNFYKMAAGGHFYKMAAGGHFGWSFLIEFLIVYSATFIFFHKMAAGGHFGWPKITFDRISRHFRSIHNFDLFHKMAAGGHFGWPKITFDCISRHFRSIRNFFFHKMAVNGHFGWPKITFDRISDQYTTLFFVSQNDCRRQIKSLLITFLVISDQCATFIFLFFFSKWPPAAILEVPFRPFWMTENHFRSHFSPFQSNTQLFFWKFDSKWPPAAILEVQFAPKTIWFFHYVLSMAMPNMKLIGEFVTQLEMPQAFWASLYKMAARGHFVFPIDDKNHRVLVIWDLNGYGEYEFDRCTCICDKVMACTSIGVRRRRRRRRRNQKHNITEIFKFRGYNEMFYQCVVLFQGRLGACAVMFCWCRKREDEYDCDSVG